MRCNLKPLKNRETAGQLLAEKLKRKKWIKTIVLAIPRGGVPVGVEIAKQLKLPFDIILVKKIGAPEQPEFAIGAICENQHPLWNKEVVAMLGLQKETMMDLVDKTRYKIMEQSKKWRANRTSIPLKDRTIILVDDGLATGQTMMAAVEYLKQQQVTKIVIAVPVSSVSALDDFRDLVDQIIVLDTPEPFFAISQWYEDFTQVTDDLVTQILSKNIRKDEPYDFTEIGL
jgi:predicted phosphoribosyltransferase